jgi:hypothetical protein
VSEPRDEELSRIYREIEQPQPPRRVDDAILAASRRAVGAKPQPVRRMLTRFWDNPVAIAATIVLTFTVTLMMLEQSPKEEMGKETTLSRDSARFDSERPAPAQAPVDSLERRSEANEKAREAEPPKPAAPAPRKRASESAARRDVGGAQGPSEERPAQKLGFVPDAPARADANVNRNVQPQAMQDKPAQPEAQAPAPAALEFDQRLRRSESAPTLQAPAPATRAAAPAPASPAASASGALSESAAGNFASNAIGDRGITAQQLAEAKQRSPEDWIKAIRALKTDGRTADVQRELAEFKRRYPDYRLPDDLR